MMSQLSRTQKFLIILFTGVIITGGAVRLILSSEWYARRIDRHAALNQVRMIRVDVDGAVKTPGVYELPAGAVRDDAVRLAGGRTPDADTSEINLAEEITDQEKIYIPFRSEHAPTAGEETLTDYFDETALDSGADQEILETVSPEADSPESDGENRPDRKDAAAAAPENNPGTDSPHRVSKSRGRVMININTASAEELEQLPGIGPAYAQRIVELRKARGPYRIIEEIMLVKGIGEKRFEQLKPMITVR